MLICVVTVIWAQEEAKDAFKELLVAVQVASDWSWDKTMRSIISDPRYASPNQNQRAAGMLTRVFHVLSHLQSSDKHTAALPEEAYGRALLFRKNAHSIQNIGWGWGVDIRDAPA